jgi:hypothetical protein
VRARVATALGVSLVDIEDGQVFELGDDDFVPRAPLQLDLPLLRAADRHGSRVVALVDRRPPLVVSDDAGATWREAGGGLPAGRDVAISPEHPDLVLFATETRLYLSRDGGRFWEALELELHDITAVAWE